MPVYEYRCGECGKRYAHLVGMTADSPDPVCPKCKSTRAERLISRISLARSEDERLDALEDAAFAGDPDDPRAMSRLLREMGSELDDGDGEDLDELVDEAEREFYDAEDESADLDA